MKTAFKLLLLSASFLSVDAFAKPVWKEKSRIPASGEDKATITNLAVSADGMTIYLTERLPYIEQLWKSTNGGLTWFVLEDVK